MLWYTDCRLAYTGRLKCSAVDKVGLCRRADLTDTGNANGGAFILLLSMFFPSLPVSFLSFPLAAIVKAYFVLLPMPNSILYT